LFEPYYPSQVRRGGTLTLLSFIGAPRGQGKLKGTVMDKLSPLVTQVIPLSASNYKLSQPTADRIVFTIIPGNKVVGATNTSISSGVFTNRTANVILRGVSPLTGRVVGSSSIGAAIEVNFGNFLGDCNCWEPNCPISCPEPPYSIVLP